jgi:hypothetical protein
VKQPFEHLDGWLEIPSAPGLGIEVDRAVINGALARP